MSVLIHSIQEVSKWVEENTHSRVKDFWLMGSILPVTVITAFYLTFVLKVGPEFMKNRRPYNIDRVVMVYNAVQVLFSVYVVRELFRLIWSQDDTRIFCYLLSKNDPDIANQQARLAWLVVLGKFLDYLDTIFYVLRKKQSQVTFLHVYHHTLVVVSGWWLINFHAGEQTAFFGTINSCIHTVMYTYYLLTTVDSKYKKVWWKKYLTIMQMMSLQLFYSFQQASKWVEENTDPRVKDLWLMGSILPVTVVIVSYLAFIFKIGPEFMRYRRPLKIDVVVMVYNAVQVLFSIYLVTKVFRLVWLRGDVRFFCILLNKSDPDLANQQARLIWMFLLVRFLDLLDTVFHVLRKKQNQVTFLHVYHHTMVVLAGWWTANFYTGEQIAFVGTVNTCVHIIMYSYYLLTTINSKYRNAWWKKYLTIIQMVQFVIVGFHAAITLLESDCEFNRILPMLFIPLDALMFILFWNFYQKTYVKQKKHKQS